MVGRYSHTGELGIVVEAIADSTDRYATSVIRPGSGLNLSEPAQVMRTNLSHIFTQAISRLPGQSAVAGLRATDRGAPDIARFRDQHAAYVSALEAAGVQVTLLEPLEAYPDSTFVEDAALCLPEGAIVLRPGAETRLGEAAEIAPALHGAYGGQKVRYLEGPGFLDGGDVMVTDREVLVGLSVRTNQAGIAALTELVEPWSYSVRAVQTPPGVLHFKSDSAPLGGTRVLSTRRLAESGCFDGYEILLVPEGEEAAANALRVNEKLFLAAGFPKTEALLTGAAYDLEVLNMTEAALLDGGLSCLSLRFRPAS